MDEVAFSQASEWYRQRGKGFSYSAKLKLYGLFKQVHRQQAHYSPPQLTIDVVRFTGLKDSRTERECAHERRSVRVFTLTSDASASG